MGSSGGLWPVPIIPPVNSLAHSIPVSIVLKKDAMESVLNGGPAKEEPFIAAQTIPVVPLPCGISPFRKGVPSAISPISARRQARKGSSNDVPKKNAGIVRQNKRARYLRLPSIIFFCVNRRCIS